MTEAVGQAACLRLFFSFEFECWLYALSGGVVVYRHRYLSSQTQDESQNWLADNAQFLMSVSGTTYTLYFTGADSGDYELGKTYTVRIGSSKADGSEVLTEDYILKIGNVNEHTPEVTQDSSVKVVTGADIETPVFTLDVRDRDHVRAEDEENDPIQFILQDGLADNDKFEIDKNGAVTVKSGEITSYNFGDEYKITVLVANKLGEDIKDITYPLLPEGIRVDTSRDERRF